MGQWRKKIQDGAPRWAECRRFIMQRTVMCDIVTSEHVDTQIETDGFPAAGGVMLRWVQAAAVGKGNTSCDWWLVPCGRTSYQ